MFVIMQSSAFLPTPAKGAGAVEYLVAKLAVALAHLDTTIALLCLEGSKVEHSKIQVMPMRAYGSAVAREGEMSKAVAAIIARGLGRELGGPVLFDHSLHQLSQRRVPQLPALTMSHGMAPLSPWAHNPVFTSRHHGHLHGVRHPKALLNAIDVNEVPFSVEREDYLVWAGRILPYKQPHLAAEVARATGMKLLLAGPIIDADYARQLQPDNNVLLLGEVAHEQLLRTMGSAQALLFTSDETEPAGIVQLEAQAAGTPVIAFRGGASAEFLEDGKTGLLVTTFADMVAAVQDRFWERLAPVNCRRWVAEHRSIENMAKGALSFLQRALKGEQW
jgi:glycosyltransferase involved in cell wall biosynthesis